MDPGKAGAEERIQGGQAHTRPQAPAWVLQLALCGSGESLDPPAAHRSTNDIRAGGTAWEDGSRGSSVAGRLEGEGERHTD
jgi:hypothetical protein